MAEFQRTRCTSIGLHRPLQSGLQSGHPGKTISVNCVLRSFDITRNLTKTFNLRKAFLVSVCLHLTVSCQFCCSSLWSVYFLYCNILNLSEIHPMWIQYQVSKLVLNVTHYVWTSDSVSVHFVSSYRSLSPNEAKC